MAHGAAHSNVLHFSTSAKMSENISTPQHERGRVQGGSSESTGA